MPPIHHGGMRQTLPTSNLQRSPNKGSPLKDPFYNCTGVNVIIHQVAGSKD